MSEKFEMSAKREQPGKNREKLLILEKEGKVVFHGSQSVIETLEPQQAHKYNKKTGMSENDGKPAVFATPFAEVAIFRALVTEKTAVGNATSGFGINGDQLHFAATKNLLEQAKNIVGKVYVLDKKKFKYFKGTQCRSRKPVVPIEIIEVTAGDLPQNIEIIEQHSGS